VISRADWEAIKINDQGDVVWSWRNNWTVKVDQLSEVALNYIANVDTSGLKILYE
jgi:ABC-type transporter Mla MlaB component